MRAVIVGGGSVGLLMAARLQLGGVAVHLLTRSEEQAECIRASKIILHELDNQIQTVPVLASSFEQKWPLADIYLIAVKQTQLNSIVQKLQQIPPGAKVIALQNGMGHRELLAESVPSDQLYFGVNTEGARRISLHEVVHTGQGIIRIGPWVAQLAQDPVVQAFVDRARRGEIPAEYVDETSSLLWRKLAANAVINPLTAIAEVSNGQLLEVPSMLELMRSVFEEVRMVAKAFGHKLAENDWQDILYICRSTSKNYSSMLQDLLNNKETEIDSINGYIVERARELEIMTPMNDTLYRAVLLKSNLPRSKGETFDEIAE
ncbi:ketopantoate reductase family protein [Brevibacillus ginsengisoli]|uniref:ketopantoate reductase family protein n=1 Tax=Brevibacillus ginsengisoli TaxID=363854 RepID=UPI003CF7F90C